MNRNNSLGTFARALLAAVVLGMIGLLAVIAFGSINRASADEGTDQAVLLAVMDKLDSLETKLNGIEGQLDPMQRRFLGFALQMRKLDAVESVVESIDAVVGDLDSAVSEVQSTVSDIESSASTIDDDVAALHDLIESTHLIDPFDVRIDLCAQAEAQATTQVEAGTSTSFPFGLGVGLDVYGNGVQVDSMTEGSWGEQGEIGGEIEVEYQACINGIILRQDEAFDIDLLNFEGMGQQEELFLRDYMVPHADVISNDLAHLGITTVMSTDILDLAMDQLIFASLAPDALTYFKADHGFEGLIDVLPISPSIDPEFGALRQFWTGRESSNENSTRARAAANPLDPDSICDLIDEVFGADNPIQVICDASEAADVFEDAILSITDTVVPVVEGIEGVVGDIEEVVGDIEDGVVGLSDDLVNFTADIGVELENTASQLEDFATDAVNTAKVALDTAIDAVEGFAIDVCKGYNGLIDSLGTWDIDIPDIKTSFPIIGSVTIPTSRLRASNKTIIGTESESR